MKKYGCGSELEMWMEQEARDLSRLLSPNCFVFAFPSACIEGELCFTQLSHKPGMNISFLGSEHKYFPVYWSFLLIPSDTKGSVVKIQKAPRPITAVKPTASVTGRSQLIDLFMVFLGPGSKTPSPHTESTSKSLSSKSGMETQLVLSGKLTTLWQLFIVRSKERPVFRLLCPQSDEVGKIAPDLQKSGILSWPADMVKWHKKYRGLSCITGLL